MTQDGKTQASVNLLKELHQYRPQETHDIVDGLPDDKFAASCTCGWESVFYWDTPYQAELDFIAHVAESTKPVQTYRVRTIRVQEQWATVKAYSAEQAKRLVLVEAGQADQLDSDPEFDDVGEYDFPQPIDELAFWIDLVKGKEGEQNL